MHVSNTCFILHAAYFILHVHVYTVLASQEVFIGERERANLVVHLAAIFLYIYMYMGIYTRRMHGIVGERERSNCVVDMRCI